MLSANNEMNARVPIVSRNLFLIKLQVARFFVLLAFEEFNPFNAYFCCRCLSERCIFGYKVVPVANTLHSNPNRRTHSSKIGTRIR